MSYHYRMLLRLALPRPLHHRARGGLIHILSWFVATRRGRVIYLLSVPWLLLLAWLTSVAWFLTDDAFISFRYVRNLLEGHGLVFNPGEYVEGYTNFLWVLELAALWGLFGWQPEHAANWLSVTYTGLTLLALWWWLARSPSRHDRGFLAWLALGLLGSSATFAVWTSGGGLETRQFTCFIVVAVVCLAVHGKNRWGLLAASLSLAAAALTRPEGLLLAACCFGWFAVQRLASTHRANLWAAGRNEGIAGRLATVMRRLGWRELTYLVAPFAVLVTAHFLFRYGYYGDWLPNTYYAKHVRPWYESGFRYLWAAALETGLYLLLPLTWVALRERWRRYRDGIYALVLLCIGAHLYYVMRIGGDHFEYRPLDFYWPLLALPAAEGLVYLGARLAARLQWKRTFVRGGVEYPRAWAVAIFVPVLFYSSAIQGALLDEDNLNTVGHIELDDKNAGWLLMAPGMPVLVAISNDLRRQSARQFVRLPTALHRRDSNNVIAVASPYEKMERGIIPDDAVTYVLAAGITPYYVPDLQFIDQYGLTNATVAHNPATHPNHARYMAHDRTPPPGYLQQRGVNFRLHGPATSAYRALASANYALQVGPELWMPFDAADHQWANERFAGRDLRARNRFSLTDPAGNRLRVGDRHYVGAQFLGRFEGGMDGWQIIGEAITNHYQYEFYQDQQPIFGHVGPGFLTSYHPDAGNTPTGQARSPKFTAADGHYLALLVGGDFEGNAGVRLLADGQEVAVWHGPSERPSGFEHFAPVVHPLTAVAGQTLQLELFDDDPAGHIMLDHALLVREARTATTIAGAKREAG